MECRAHGARQASLVAHWVKLAFQRFTFEELRTGARELVQRQVEHARVLLGHSPAETSIARGGRKAHQLEVESD